MTDSETQNPVQLADYEFSKDLDDLLEQDFHDLEP